VGRAARSPERAALLILLLHNRYRTPGGEERAVEDLAWLIREELGEAAAVLERDSAALGPARAATGLLAGGVRPQSVADAVRRAGARVVHAHNVHPAFGWRALAAARDAGARVVLHLHNYRLVCAIGTCFTRGEDCTRCHGRNTLPGVRLNCRGSRAESLVYGASLAAWQRRLAEFADAFAVPSEFALGRLRELGAPLGARARVVPSVQRSFAAASTAASGRFALAAGRLTPEKGFKDAIRACASAGVPLVVAGDGPQREELQALGGDVRFVGRVSASELAELRREAALAVVPSRYAEILPLAALEAMAAGLPVVASGAGGLVEAVPGEGLYPPGDVAALAERVAALFGDAAAGERSLEVARARYAPSVVASKLRALYDGRTAAG
jgi:glycosyltransferase involved in cell wall biosynthesis